jgi:hypothetical protein
VVLGFSRLVLRPNVYLGVSLRASKFFSGEYVPGANLEMVKNCDYGKFPGLTWGVAWLIDLSFQTKCVFGSGLERLRALFRIVGSRGWQIILLNRRKTKINYNASLPGVLLGFSRLVLRPNVYLGVSVSASIFFSGL